MAHPNNNSLKISIGTFIKIEPFLYNVLYILIFIRFMFPMTELTAYFLTMLTYSSPIIVLFGLARSKSAKFCKYHRLAVCAPLVGTAIVVFNDWVCQIPVSGVAFASAISILTTILTIFTGVKVFKSNERRMHKRNA